MVQSSFGRRLCFVLLLAFLQCPAASGQEGGALANLVGRWAGPGKMIPASGPTEDFRCVITYFLTHEYSQVRQNLRCQGINYKFDAATRLHIEAGQVVGEWADNVYSLAGTVTGTLTDNGFDIQLSGRFFTARMIVVSSHCEQTINVVAEPVNHVRELSAVLKKC